MMKQGGAVRICQVIQRPYLLQPELWRLVVQYLSNEGLRGFFAVCRLFYDLSSPVLFSHVTIRLGLWRADDWGAEEEEPSDMLLTDQQLSEYARNLLKAREMLSHIQRTPSFANVVRKLSVRAYFVVDGDGEPELYALKEAILAMTNITSFCWEGRRPLPTGFVLDALAQSSSHTLRALSLPSSKITQSCLKTFKRLQSITLHYALHTEDYASMNEGLEENNDTLTHLTLYGNATWSCPLRSLSHLHELELLVPMSFHGFGSVLTRCISLRYLTLHAECYLNQDLFESLESHATALPDLIAFKLLGADLLALQPLGSLAHFLQSKNRLRLLDLASASIEDEDEEGGVPLPLLEVLQQLPALEVLGLTITRDKISSANIGFLRQYIPLRLTALMVRLELYGNIVAAEWINLITKLSSLRYLHVLDEAESAELKKRLRENLPSSLELFGYGSSMHWVERGAGQVSSGVQLATPWPISRVRFYTVEDFACADWEWLFRHHAFEAIDLDL